MKKTIKIFISSPGDVIAERNKAMQIIKRLNRHYGADVKIEGVFWEREPMRATQDYQTNIVKPSSTDIVAVIIWTRLGSNLDLEYKGAVTGKQPITGTEWEFEDAYAKAINNDNNPHVALYRKKSDDVKVSSKEIDEFKYQEKLIKAFDDYWAKNEDGSYSMAQHSFERTDEFERMFEEHLKKLIEQILNQKLEFKANWLDGSPFRGLQSFEAEHNSVFFGREREKNESREKLEEQIAKGHAFVLITGASGSGKSSLVKAGLLPDLQIDGMVNNVAVTRVTTFTPSDDEPCKALISSVFKALPELKELQYTQENLHEHLDDGFAIKQALDTIAKEEKLTKIAQAKLIVYVDQFEELFTSSNIDEKMQEAFIALLFKLFSSSHVWVVASMRSDFMSHLDKFPKLLTLLNNGAEYKLGFPKPTEIGQIIVKPAREAGLNFEVDSNGKGLDDFLRESASKNQASLPLLEYLLDQLWEQRDQEKNRLTFEAYERLGGLDGAIGQKADAVYQTLKSSEQKAMSSLLIMFASMREENNKITAKRVPKEQIEKNPNLKACAKALLDPNVRLLISAKDDKGAEYYRVAHEALFTHWELAQKTITRHTKDIQLRDQLEKSSKRWKLAKKEDKKSLLLHDGLPLNEAVDLVERRESELDGLLVEFVRASEERVRRSKRLNRLFWGTLLSVSLLVSFFMYGLKKEADRVTDKLVTIVGMYADEGRDRFEKDKNQSIKIFEAIIENFEDSKNSEIMGTVSTAYYIKGIDYNAKKEYDKAIEVYQKAIQINPKDDEAYNGMGISYGDKEEYDNAIEAYKKAIELNPKKYKAYYNMGITYEDKKEYNKAIEAYKKAIKLNPKDDSSYTKIGNIYKNKEEYDKSLNSYEQAIKINFKNNVARTHMGITYSEMKEWNKAILVYKEAIKVQLDNSVAYDNMGNAYYAKKEYDNAIEAYQMLIEINPKDYRAYYKMGSAYNNKNEYDNAIEAYQMAIEINPKYDEAYYTMGVVYNNIGIIYRAEKEYNKAIETFEKAIALNSKYDEAYYNKGVVYSIKEEFDQAIEAYQKAIELNPKYDEAYYNMGIAYRVRKEYNKAIEAYQMAIEINPNSYRYVILADFYYMSLKNFDKAREYYKESFKLGIDSSGFLNFYELQLITNKDINESIEKNYIANFKTKKEKFIKYEMLKIIKDLTQNKKVDVKAWQSKYEGVHLDWGFTELDEWVKTLKDEALKKKINEALEVFKGHG